MKMKALVIGILLTVGSMSSAMACPKGTHIEGGVGPYGKGGKCVPNTPVEENTKAPEKPTPTAAPAMAEKPSVTTAPTLATKPPAPVINTAPPALTKP